MYLFYLHLFYIAHDDSLENLSSHGIIIFNNKTLRAIAINYIYLSVWVPHPLPHKILMDFVDKTQFKAYRTFKTAQL